MTRGKVPVSPSKLRGRCQIDDREHAQIHRTTRSMTEHRTSVCPCQSTRADLPRTIQSVGAGNVCQVGRIRLIASIGATRGLPTMPRASSTASRAFASRPSITRARSSAGGLRLVSRRLPGRAGRPAGDADAALSTVVGRRMRCSGIARGGALAVLFAKRAEADTWIEG